MEAVHESLKASVYHGSSLSDATLLAIFPHSSMLHTPTLIPSLQCTPVMPEHWTQADIVGRDCA